MRNYIQILFFLFCGFTLFLLISYDTISAKNLVWKHSQFKTEFNKNGVVFTSQSSPRWEWKLLSFAGKKVNSTFPKEISKREIEFRYQDFSENYVLKENTVEQLFIVKEYIGNSDLIVEGQVSSEGRLKKFRDGWAWVNHKGLVHWNKIKVFDANQKDIPAKLEVENDIAKIIVDGSALAMASYPVTIDPEIGTNDFRISEMGPDGNAGYYTGSPEVAYNSTDDEYLVVWSAADDSHAANAFEIWGQLYKSNGVKIGPMIQISDMGLSDSNTSYDAINPFVAYNSTDNEYLVVWSGDDDTAPLVDEEDEIFGQLLDDNGFEIGTNDFRISDMGSNGDTDYDAENPTVAYNTEQNEYLVVWYGDDDSLADNELEIWGQVLDEDGNEIGTNDFRISDMGETDNDDDFDAYSPKVAYNSVENEYLVVWVGDDDSGSLVDGEQEIWGQLIHESGLEIGSDFRISDMGSDGDIDYYGNGPNITYNSTDNEYLVVWHGDDPSLANDAGEIWGQRLDEDGTEVGTNDFRISDMGATDTDTSFAGYFPSVAYNSVDNQYLVVWRGDDDTSPLVNNEEEVFGQILEGDGDELGADTRLSDMGTNGDTVYGVQVSPAAIHNPATNQYLIAWTGDDDNIGLAWQEYEIFGQLYNYPVCGNGFLETGETCDDGNNSNTDSCLNTCVPSSCGDGYVEDGEEECDNGGSNSDVNADACRSTCVEASCGDSVKDSGESCDDGDLDNEDACLNTCTLATCGDAIIQSGEECDDGDSNSNVTANACRTTCVEAYCGDGMTDTGEQCDDGNLVNNDSCTNSCVSVSSQVSEEDDDEEESGEDSDVCGDGDLDDGEECDDGNNENVDGCSSICDVEVFDDLESANPDVDFSNLEEGETIEINSPDPDGSASINVDFAYLATDANCDCSWSLTPASFGDFDDDQTCATELTVSEGAEQANLLNTVDCGEAGSASFNQTLIVTGTTSETTGGGSSGSSSGGGCDLSHRPTMRSALWSLFFLFLPMVMVRWRHLTKR